MRIDLSTFKEVKMHKMTNTYFPSCSGEFSVDRKNYNTRYMHDALYKGLQIADEIDNYYCCHVGIQYNAASIL
jgi:hypothetical protein